MYQTKSGIVSTPLRPPGDHTRALFVPVVCTADFDTRSHTSLEGVSCHVSRSCLSVNAHQMILSVFQHRWQHVCREVEGEDANRVYAFSMHNDWEPRQKDAKTTEMKLTANMLTNTGFISLGLGEDATIHQTDQFTPHTKKYYVGISGGGFRAFSGHIGAFRALNNRSALPSTLAAKYSSNMSLLRNQLPPDTAETMSTVDKTDLLFSARKAPM